jgi:DNA-binding MarR family transcriptional regulator
MADDVLTQAWSRLAVVFSEYRDQFFGVLGEHSLTPPHGFALKMLADGPVRMREMADQMACDASYITAIVDRLEETGLVERRPNDSDRRVKEIALTTKGKRVAATLTKAMTAPPAILYTLDPADRQALLDILVKLVPDDQVGASPFGPIRR